MTTISAIASLLMGGMSFAPKQTAMFPDMIGTALLDHGVFRYKPFPNAMSDLRETEVQEEAQQKRDRKCAKRLRIFREYGHL